MKNYLNILFLGLGMLFPFSMFAQHSEEKLNLMPWPQKIEIKEGTFLLNKDFNLSIKGSYNDRILSYSNSFLRRLDGRTGLFFNQGIINKNTSFSEKASLKIEIEREGKVKLHEDESYTLDISEDGIVIKAITDIGAIRALETVLQLQTYSEDNYYFPFVSITDAPRFAWRGLMIDVSRHFQPVHVIKRNLDAMAAVKLNLFHWHLSDDQGFRVEIKKHPKLTEMGSDGNFYTQNQIKDVVAYAAARGIQVVPEIDVPGHASALLTAYPNLGSAVRENAIERNAGIFDPTLDPTNKGTYKLLADIFKEMADLFPSPYVHIGGDENEGKDWDNNQSIQGFMVKNDLKTNHDLQTYFNIKLQKILQKNGKHLIGWEEVLTETIPTSVIIHSWRGVNEGFPAKQSLVNAVKNGNQTILSNGYYIDLMSSVEDHYLVDPMPDIDLTDVEKNRVLGGEATMWSELVTSNTIDSRIWPRTAAIAERFWSSKEIIDIESMYRRLDVISYQLEELGMNHISNRDVILRNIVDNQSIEAVKLLTSLCEPLKGYTRNKGGVEYQMYSPLTLFADACVADAKYKREFNKLVVDFVNNPLEKTLLIDVFDSWSQNHSSFLKLKMNPKVNELEPLFENLSKVSNSLIELITSEVVDIDQVEQLNADILKLEEPYVDVEFAIIESLKILSIYYNDLCVIEKDYN